MGRKKSGHSFSRTERGSPGPWIYPGEWKKSRFNSERPDADNRPEWCREMEKYSVLSLFIAPDEILEVRRKTLDGRLIDKIEMVGPCIAAAAVVD
jgi:hypothetical protein